MTTPGPLLFWEETFSSWVRKKSTSKQFWVQRQARKIGRHTGKKLTGSNMYCKSTPGQRRPRASIFCACMSNSTRSYFLVSHPLCWIIFCSSLVCSSLSHQIALQQNTTSNTLEHSTWYLNTLHDLICFTKFRYATLITLPHVTCITWQCVTLCYVVLRCSTFHFLALRRYITLRCNMHVSVRYSTFHCITSNQNDIVHDIAHKNMWHFSHDMA